MSVFFSIIVTCYKISLLQTLVTFATIKYSHSNFKTFHLYVIYIQIIIYFIYHSLKTGIVIQIYVFTNTILLQKTDLYFRIILKFEHQTCLLISLPHQFQEWYKTLSGPFVYFFILVLTQSQAQNFHSFGILNRLPILHIIMLA